MTCASGWSLSFLALLAMGASRRRKNGSRPSPSVRRRRLAWSCHHGCLTTSAWSGRVAVTRGGRARAQQLLEAQVSSGNAARVAIEGIGEPAYLSRDRLADLERLRAGMRPERTVFLSPFDSLIWDRARARTLFGYAATLRRMSCPKSGATAIIRWRFYTRGDWWGGSIPWMADRRAHCARGLPGARCPDRRRAGRRHRGRAP